MPWKDKTVEKLRAEFIVAAAETSNFSRLCREFGISRPTGYKWVARSREGLGVGDLSHNPKRIPGKTAPEIEQLILRVREDN